MMSLESSAYSTHVDKMKYSLFITSHKNYGHANVAQHTHARTSHAWATKLKCIMLPYHIVGGLYDPLPTCEAVISVVS
jgi:hypothetical protein